MNVCALHQGPAPCLKTQQQQRGEHQYFPTCSSLFPGESPVNQLSPPHGNGEGKTRSPPLLAVMGKRSSIYFPLLCSREEEEKGGCGKEERRSSWHGRSLLMTTLGSTKT